ncbi:MAG TPA: hypothetical protein VF588_20810 [Pyrinomonadaceae bacterium]
MLDITIIVFVLSIVVVGVLLTVTIRRDFVNRKRFQRDLRRQTDHIRARRRPAERP